MMRRSYLLSTLLFVLGLGLFACGESNEPPTVTILSPSEGESLGGTVQFEIEYGDTDGEIASVKWDFGDGTTSSEANPTHTYQQKNSYRVDVVVTDSDGATARDGVVIDVEIGPTAIATVGRIDSGEPIVIQFIEDEAPLQVEFDGLRSRASPGSSIASYHWDFGNGEESDEPNPQYVYQQAGEYQAVLTVTDDQGRSSQARVTVRVRSYESAQGTIELSRGPINYELYSRNSRSTTTGPSMFFQYVIDADRVLSEDEINTILNDIIEQAKSRPRVAKISVQLYTEEKEEMMTPREYSHYVGSAIWVRDEEGDPISITLNNAYLDGTGKEVYGFKIRESLLNAGDPDCGLICSQYKIGLADIFIQSENVCKQILDQTLEEIIQWRLNATYHGFLAAVYDIKDLADPVAWISGVREEGPDLTELPYQLFLDSPPGWNTPKGDLVRINYVSGLPSCQ